MNLPLRIVIPGAPTAKGRPRITTIGGRPRAFTPAKTRNYESFIQAAGYAAMAGAAPVDQALAVTVTAYIAMPHSMPKKHREAALSGDYRPTTRPDVDNYAKTLDGLNGVVWRDDSLISDLIVRKRYAAVPRLEIVVEAADPRSGEAVAIGALIPNIMAGIIAKMPGGAA
jgi:Holliday junction resolvase RusA-like endonuclease